ncbi:hypothetical protein CSPHI_04115 [Corynebacterium sphenisci DSM 44792]|uniref:HNH nuclease domain-containing protein n=1 Tax=Corynebacterium sphenisci DSM 44792 TaxID=1437874 RepID=A0A1L7CX30_9CORY|nr:HNH endonuclease [Corynebacterium sphenisci]APT90371.1 hypothetical protein CSPHI_04115 [Corynebacterium sphenisci DSM 44792]
MAGYSEQQPFWKLDYYPGTRRKLGSVPKIASYLYHEVEVGATFTTDELRLKLGRAGQRVNHEHFQRRIREIKDLDWNFRNHQEDAELDVQEYRLVKKGWTPESGKPRKRDPITASVRRQVFERDRHFCQICGAHAGDEYPGEDGTRVVLTVGHIVPRSHGGEATLQNLQAECARCNEPKRDSGDAINTYDNVWPDVKKLGRKDKQELLRWLTEKRRDLSPVEIVYAKIHKMRPDDRDRLMNDLQTATGKY